MLKSNYLGALMGATNKAIAQFVLTGTDQLGAQRAIQSCRAMASTVAQATVDCIKESNSVDEVISFAKLNPSAYVNVMARARIRELSASERKSTVLGGHETND